MLNRTLIWTALVALSLPASAAGIPPHGQPFCIKDKMIVCDYVLFDANDSTGVRTVQLQQVNDQFPAIGSVELHRLPPDPDHPSVAGYVVLFVYVTPVPLPAS